MTAENLLQKLDRVKKTGLGKWQACCPAHDDRGPSLAVRELDDGRVLIHCFAGCGAADVLAAVGLDFAELYPAKISGDFVVGPRKPWNATEVLTALSLEILVAWHFSKSMANGVALSAADGERLLLCAARMQRGLEVANGR
jgi:hypothetical protein